MTENDIEKELRREAIQAAIRYYDAVHRKSGPFVPGDRIPYAGRVFDEEEISNLVDASLDFWLTAGRYADAFERDFAAFLGTGCCALANSGSSANLLAFMALTSPALGDKRIERGDEVITIAAGFPTTVSPIIQYGAVPVFIDIALPTYNVDCSQLDKAVTAKTKAVMLAHTLGNPFDLRIVRDFCEANRLWLIEDNCDSLGSRYFLNGAWKLTGTIGHIGTSSFYPPHHMTMGEGGAVYTDDPQLGRIIISMRDWGRDCWCPSGQDNTCANRFSRQFGGLPAGYDHKYVYSHFGYNLKATDLQAAIGCAQLKKLPAFIRRRKENFKLLYERLEDLAEYVILPEPTPGSEPSWFGFPLTLRDDCGIQRNSVSGYLEKQNIQTRNLFAGNLTLHPCFEGLREGLDYRIAGELTTTNKIMRDCFWVGVYPGIGEAELHYIADKITESITSERAS